MSQSIGDARAALGLTQAELARRVKVDVRTLARWEAGETHPTRRNLRRLAKALGVSVSDLA
jgi:transcriptional regulator with XRE-family HTH domain